MTISRVHWLRTAATLLAGTATWAGAQAATVFDSFTGALGNTSQCLICTGGNPTLAQLGDIITLGGTERQVQSVSIRLTQATLTEAQAFTANLTLSLYAVDVTALSTTLISSSSTALQIGSTGQYQATFNFNNVVVPSTLYYGFSASSASPNLAGLRVALWDYWSTAAGGDGPLLAGSDPGTVFNSATSVSSVVFGRLASNPAALVASTGGGLGTNQLSLGFTPSIQITAVPEPATYGLMALGLVAIGAAARRRKQG